MKVIVTLPDETIREAAGAPGGSIMQLLRNAGLPISAACGGAMACATCHVEVAEVWRGQVGAAGPEESDLLDSSDYLGPGSRLCCQIPATAALDGLAVTLKLDAVD